MAQSPRKTVGQFLPKWNIRSSSCIPWCLFERAVKLFPHSNPHVNVYGSLIHNCLNLEATKTSFNRWWINRLWHICTRCISLLKLLEQSTTNWVALTGIVPQSWSLEVWNQDVGLIGYVGGLGGRICSMCLSLLVVCWWSFAFFDLWKHNSSLHMAISLCLCLCVQISPF